MVTLAVVILLNNHHDSREREMLHSLELLRWDKIWIILFLGGVRWACFWSQSEKNI